MTTQVKKQKGAPRRKNRGGNDKPSRSKYWNMQVLVERKIKALMRNKRVRWVNGIPIPDPMTRREAHDLWYRTRKTRWPGANKQEKAS